MNKKLAKSLKARNVNLAPLNKGTVERINRLSLATGSTATQIIDAATQVLEHSLGKEIILKDMDTDVEEKINTYTKYKKSTNTQDDEQSK